MSLIKLPDADRVTIDATPAEPNPADSARAAFTAGLREIADFLDAHPEVPLPNIGSYPHEDSGYVPTLTAFASLAARDGRSQLDIMRAAARAMGRSGTKGLAIGPDPGFVVYRRFGGIHLVIEADREEVCERVVVGTHQVTEEVPDPDVVAAAPLVTRTRVVEDVRWECRPLLREAPTAAETAAALLTPDVEPVTAGSPS